MFETTRPEDNSRKSIASILNPLPNSQPLHVIDLATEIRKFIIVKSESYGLNGGYTAVRVPSTVLTADSACTILLQLRAKYGYLYNVPGIEINKMEDVHIPTFILQFPPLTTFRILDTLIEPDPDDLNVRRLVCLLFEIVIRKDINTKDWRVEYISVGGD